MEEVESPSGRETIRGRDWTKGSIVQNVLLLSWPIMVNNSLNMLGPTIDVIWVGKLGAAPLAGVGVAGMAQMLVTSAMMGLIVGVRAMIARFVGMGDHAGANHVARQAYIIGASYSLVMASIGIFLAETILTTMGLEPDVVAEGTVYLRIMFVCSIPISFRMTGEGIMQASGDTMTPMKLAVGFRLFHVALCPFLVFGWWIFPQLGVMGAAISNVISQTLGMALGLWVLFSGRTRLRLSLHNFRIDLGAIWRIVKIGLPACINGMERSLGHLVLMWVIVPFGTLAVAAHTLYHRIEIFMFMPGMGLGVGGGVLVGQNLGARQPERAERSGWLAATLAEVFTISCAVLLLLRPELIIHIFTTEPELVELTSVFMRIAAVGVFTLGFTAVLGNCISGSGDTVPPMLVTLLTIWVVQLPLALLIPRVTDLGVLGVRWAIVAGMITSSVTYITYFRLGRWKRKKV